VLASEEPRHPVLGLQFAPALVAPHHEGTMDNAQLKQEELTKWTRVAPGWRAHDPRMIRAFGVVSKSMLEASEVRKGNRVLDIASGTGEPAIPFAEAVGPQGFVLGTDFVEEMLGFAREKAAAKNLKNIEFRQADGESIDVPPGSFDIVSIRWGLMFMPNPVACVRQAKRALKRGGRIAVACWASPEQNPWLTIPMGILRRHLDVPPPQPGVPNVFSFADPKRIEAVLKEGGFEGVEVRPLDVVPADFSNTDEYFKWVLEIVGPVAALWARLPVEKREQVAKEVASQVQDARGEVHQKGVTWVALGRA
jgi:ubiquinone/menaquinone biosynthesis C-methylase UbiE